MLLKDLVTHYLEHKLPRLAFSTAEAHKSYLKLRIVPQWGNHQLQRSHSCAGRILAVIADSEKRNQQLQWHDVDFSTNTITPARGIVDKHVGGLKTAALAAAVPASKEVTDTLARWHEVTLYKEPID